MMVTNASQRRTQDGCWNCKHIEQCYSFRYPVDLVSYCKLRMDEPDMPLDRIEEQMPPEDRIVELACATTCDEWEPKTDKENNDD